MAVRSSIMTPQFCHVQALANRPAGARYTKDQASAYLLEQANAQ